MTTVLLIIQVLICIVLIGLILIQRSEGGALGIGGGGGGGGLMSGRSSANAVTKATTILGTLFILNCIALSVFFAIENPNTSFTEGAEGEVGVVQTQDSDNNQIPNADVIDPDAAQSETSEIEIDTAATTEPEEATDATDTPPESGDDE